MTFRLPTDIARALRGLPNQTRFVEEALRTALGVECPACNGTGRVSGRLPQIPNFREHGLGRLSGAQARQLKSYVELARQMGIDRIAVDVAAGGFVVVLRRGDQAVLRGQILSSTSSPTLEVS